MSSIESYQRLLTSLIQDQDATKALLAHSEGEITSIHRAMTDTFGMTSAYPGDDLMHRMILQKQQKLQGQLKAWHTRSGDLRKKIARNDKRVELIRSRLQIMTQIEERRKQELFISERIAVLAAQASGKHDPSR